MYNYTKLEELKILFDRTRKAFDSEQNRINEMKWKDNKGKKSPDGAFNLFLGASYCSRALDVDFRDYYFDPFLYLKANLQLNLLKFDKFKDDTPLTKTIPWHTGVTFESSLFGVDVKYKNDKEAWESHDNYLITDYDDLSSLAYPDFYECKAMRHIHDMYVKLKKITFLAAPDFEITFPRWRRSPFGNACILRGMEQLCMDFYDNPEFVHDLMSFVTHSRIQWEESCNGFLNESSSYFLLNDEVNIPTIGPSHYLEFILPYEKQLLNYYGILDYYHSCGDITPLLPYIKTMSPDMIQISPWTDLETAIQTFSGTKTVLDIWSHVYGDVMNASEDHILKVMKHITAMCRNSDIKGFKLMSGNIQNFWKNPEADDIKILQWVNACRKMSESC